MLKAEILNLCIWIFLWSSNWSIQLFKCHFHLSFRTQDACFPLLNYSHCFLGNGFFLLSVRYLLTSGKLSHILFTDVCELVLPLGNKRESDWRLSWGEVSSLLTWGEVSSLLTWGEVSSLLKEEGGKENVFSISGLHQFTFWTRLAATDTLAPFKFSY